ncbi:MAG: hypothetical protein LBK41_05595 [Clostridiales bacterium]|jgi:hypothetical protein|nr:hypothetical protein [Clostridiales bacterium]
MATFELGRDFGRKTTNDIGEAGVVGAASCGLDPRRVREECLISLKVYDACRLQECLTDKEIGPARAAENGCVCAEQYREGEIITPPANAASVTIDRLVVKKVIIVDKEPCAFKKGFWDVDLKYVFEYRLIFREADGSPIGQVRANSIFNKRVTLFGSVGTDIVISTDLFSHVNGESAMLNADPFILVESKAVALNAELKYSRFPHHHHPHPEPAEPNRVTVAIGLFTIVKLFRIVHLLVESRGFAVPPMGIDISPLDPCDFFDGLDFPMDIFAPPQKPEFLAGISNNIPAERKSGPCGC